ncbi:hypothetical protein FSP39_012208 [Pinctada imbricata]|uniref:TIR domain-containing protein n=1 Tax=Pinctada imbricata TaxID=66713 RepID=A0AA89BSZ0_PINIB|nr:hypothetical protein FSP39_012208 [Pinctada imbricata]
MDNHVYSAVLLILTSWISSTLSVNQSDCPAFCKCNLKQVSATCSNKKEKLEHAPAVPAYVKKLKLDSNDIPLISNSTFDNLLSINLTLLSMKSCQVRLIKENSFENLMHLKTLDLGSNVKVNVSSLKLALKSLQKIELKRLSLDYMNWKTKQLSMGIFEHLVGYRVQKLTLSGNNIQTWSDAASIGLRNLSELILSNNRVMTCDHLSTLTSLQYIDLSSNMIPRCDMGMLPPSLVILRLSHNKLRKFPKLCSDDGNTVLLPHLNELKIDYNNINTIENILHPCFPSLTHLTLEGNDIKRFPEKTFSYMPRLLYLHLNRMIRGVKVIERNAFDIPSLKRLYFRGNKFSFSVKTLIYSISFGKCKNLEILDLSYNRMPTSAEALHQILFGLKTLTQLRLESVGWKAIPEELFEMFPNMEKVWLSHNGIHKIDRSLFPEKMKLKVIYLNHNGFSSLSSGSFPKFFWKYAERIDLSGNPYPCNCDLMWFRNKLNSSPSLFHEYPQKYICSSPKEFRGIEISKFNITEEDCRTESELVITLCSTISFFVFAGFIILCLYKARWHIRYWIYLLRFRRTGIERKHDDNNGFAFDVFVSYAEEDGDFVHNILLNKLEAEHKYRLCIHARDFEAGRMIVDNIAENMTSSRQVLLVLSESFCKSKWCKLEQLIALDRWLNNESEPIVMIMLEGIHSKNMNKDMRILLSTTTYVQWTLNDTGKEVFWNQLLVSLKR